MVNICFFLFYLQIFLFFHVISGAKLYKQLG